MSQIPTQVIELIKVCVVLCGFSRVWLFATPWTVAPQAALSMGFSRQEHWCGLPGPPPGDPPDPGMEPCLLFLCTGRKVLYHQCIMGNPQRLACQEWDSNSHPWNLMFKNVIINFVHFFFFFSFPYPQNTQYFWAFS